MTPALVLAVTTKPEVGYAFLPSIQVPPNLIGNGGSWLSSIIRHPMAKRTKNEQSLLKITKMDAISVGEALLAPSGDYVLLAPSADYNQSIPPKSTNRIRCFTSRTVLLPTSAKLTRGIWEINREEILVLTVTVFKNIQEHSMKFKNIRGYSNGKIKFKNIQDFRRPVRTLVAIHLSVAAACQQI